MSLFGNPTLGDFIVLPGSPLDIFGQVQGFSWNVRGICLEGRRGIVNESLRVYALRFQLIDFWGMDELSILGESWRMT